MLRYLLQAPEHHEYWGMGGSGSKQKGKGSRPAAAAQRDVVQRGRRERERIVNLFAKFDADRSGTLTVDEVVSIFTRQSSSSTGIGEEEARKIISDFDRNGDGALNIKEFADAFSSILEIAPEAETVITKNSAAKVGGGTSKLAKRTERLEIVEAFQKYDKVMACIAYPTLTRPSTSILPQPSPDPQPRTVARPYPWTNAWKS